MMHRFEVQPTLRPYRQPWSRPMTTRRAVSRGASVPGYLARLSQNPGCLLGDQGYPFPQRRSALGHKRTFCDARAMSALPPTADMCGATRDVRFGPIADIRAITRGQPLGAKGRQYRPSRTAACRGQTLGGSPTRMSPTAIECDYSRLAIPNCIGGAKCRKLGARASSGAVLDRTTRVNRLHIKGGIR
jgi:hypothetical protein